MVSGRSSLTGKATNASFKNLMLKFRVLGGGAILKFHFI